MTEVYQTEAFSRWLRGLRDVRARQKIVVRLMRLADGNPGDVAPVGGGISELRIHDGPGYRVYYAHRGDAFVVLCGGDKSSQPRDIEMARLVLTDLEKDDA
ncbi:type II toxin-antitoxin system RelE/ParE family toxin [Rhodoplanes sp. SY1]|uniref:type II toxin-antitoxin system RelE/ParE family toxin n=1 Tax=Rhodoplanes sp. SY1 TaxID=3166646 RepID=UPI0038B47100